MSAMGASFGNSYVCTLSEAVWLNRRSDTLDHLDLNHGVCISNSLQLKYLKGRFWPFAAVLEGGGQTHTSLLDHSA